ncbi:MAG TPA: hypothetical protein PLK12_13010 [Prolixibacteraceae bacterium]|nr:hypothetical protein [Prolixibacteraceae bacterium]
MKKTGLSLLYQLLFWTCLFSGFPWMNVCAFGEAGDVRYTYVVSMERPGNHYFQIELSCKNPDAKQFHFKMPAWTPGYYTIQDLSKHVTHFQAFSEDGEPLPFKKTSKNTWQVESGKEPSFKITYEVYADELFVATSFLDASQAFLSPTGIFMFPEGELDQPVNVILKPYPGWKSISTGLDLLDASSHTYRASDFDVLFDSPILMGKHLVVEFEVQGIPHRLAISSNDTLSKTPFINDLIKIIDEAASLFGEIPYKHYTFITIGSYGGGLEHSNSCVLSCRGPVADTTNSSAYKQWLSFVAHEYFHLYNVKSIRPIELGPFDYDKECYTDLLWVSEGLTVYYETILLNRSGIFSRNECFQNFSESIAGYENRPGRFRESAASSGFDAWIHFFSPNRDAQNNTISYYDKGCIMGLLLDLQIREATRNEKSLDDVMRGLYWNYFRELKRGFTSEEFKMMCEETAGMSLARIFQYVQSVDPIDYPHYFSMAGMSIDTLSREKERDLTLGASFSNEDGRLMITNVKRGSPAWCAGLGNHTPVLTIDGQDASVERINEKRKTQKAGDWSHLRVQTMEGEEEVSVQWIPETVRTFSIDLRKDASQFQKTIRDRWLK